MNFSSETRVNEIALSNPGARRVLEDAGVDYCCGGGKSLQDACLPAGVTADQILQRLRQNSELAGPEDTEWTSASLADLTRHIRERHHQYVRDSIPRVRALLAKIREKHGPKHREIGEIEKLFGDVAREMTAHMQKEEQILFPYIDALERSARGNWFRGAAVLPNGAESNSRHDARARLRWRIGAKNSQGEQRLQGSRRCLHQLSGNLSGTSAV